MIMAAKSLIFMAAACLIATPCVRAQARVGLSLKAGFHGTGWFPTATGREQASDFSSPWTVGPSVEFRLTDAIAFEASGLYQKLETESSGGYPGFSWWRRTRGNGWEFPMLAKLRILPPVRGLKPFVLGGPSIFRVATASDRRWTTMEYDPVLGGPVTRNYSASSSETKYLPGISVGAGVERRAGALRLTMEARMNFWSGRETINFGGGDIKGPQQVLFTAGLGF